VINHVIDHARFTVLRCQTVQKRFIRKQSVSRAVAAALCGSKAARAMHNNPRNSKACTRRTPKGFVQDAVRPSTRLVQTPFSNIRERFSISAANVPAKAGKNHFFGNCLLREIVHDFVSGDLGGLIDRITVNAATDCGKRNALE
jgi:hypothetical protein